MSVQDLVRGMKARGGIGEIVLGDVAIRDRDRHLVALTAVAQIEAALDLGWSVEAFLQEVGACLRFQLAKKSIRPCRREGRQQGRSGSHIIVHDVGAEQPECRERPGIGWNQDTGDAELGRDRRCMQRTGAPERN